MEASKFIIVSTIIVLSNGISKEDPLVETKYGIVMGKEEFSISGRVYYAFKGIPYATPPTDDLRFKAPVEPSKWSRLLKTQENGPHCLQKNYLFSDPKVMGSEDCLYLNVYTPQLRVNRFASKNRLLPVMVFIHWGGFFTGFASSDYLGPEYFLDKNVILVTFNYRLGVLGFFSTDDDAAPGNFGLKDQVAALKWVQSNIENFCGDKKKVTIFGQSAGGVSVNLHMFSPESRNLFHQAISQSGTSLALWAKPLLNTRHIAQTQAALVGCNQNNSTTMLVECLRKVKADDLVESGDNFKYFSIDPLTVYVPSIEKRTPNNPKPFITQQPVDYIRKKEFYKVPWIVGVVDDEGLVRAEPILRQTDTRKALNENFDTLMPKLLALSLSVPEEKMTSLWTKIKDFYFDGELEVDITDPNSIESFINLYTDRSFTYSSYQTGLFHNLQGHERIWFYNFNYTGELSYGNVFAATSEDINYDWGVSHCDDLLYLFKSPALFSELKSNNDKIMVQTMIDLWTNFAIYGHPTPKNSLSPVNLQWRQLDNHIHDELKKEIHYLNIAGNYEHVDPPKITMEYGFYRNRFKFWEDLPLLENIKELNQTHIDF